MFQQSTRLISKLAALPAMALAVWLILSILNGLLPFSLFASEQVEPICSMPCCINKEVHDRCCGKSTKSRNSDQDHCQNRIDPLRKKITAEQSRQLDQQALEFNQQSLNAGCPCGSSAVSFSLRVREEQGLSTPLRQPRPPTATINLICDYQPILLLYQRDQAISPRSPPHC